MNINLVDFNPLSTAIFTVVFSTIIFLLCRFAVWLNEGWRTQKYFWLYAALLCLLPLFLTMLPHTPSWPSSWLEAEVSSSWLSSHHFVSDSQNKVLERGNESAASILPSLNTMILFVYVIGLVFGLVRLASQYRSLLSLIDLAKPLREYVKDNDLRSTIYNGVPKDIEILVTDRNISPFVLDFPRKQIVISEVCFQHLTPLQISLLVQHELYHLNQRDSSWLLLIQIVRVALWFNPVAYYMATEYTNAMEVECDHAVLRKQPCHAQPYAQAFVTMIEQTASLHEQSFACFNHNHHKSVKMRLIQILSNEPRSLISSLQKYSFVLAMVGVSSVMLGFHPKLLANQVVNATAFVKPVKSGWISEPYGQMHNKFHHGVDFTTDKGTLVFAVQAGEVIESKGKSDDNMHEKRIVIAHANGFQSLYTHIDTREVEVGKKVMPGDVIGRFGEDDHGHGKHMHFELIKDGDSVDPSKFIELD